MRRTVDLLRERISADRAFVGLSFREIAERLGRSESSVRQAFKALNLQTDVTRKQRRVLRYCWKNRRRGFTVRSVAKRYGVGTSFVVSTIRGKLGAKAKAFLARAADRYYRRKYAGGKKERSALWLRDIEEKGRFGFDFTGKYWKRYYRLWQRKRRRDAPVNDDGRPDYVATMLKAIEASRKRDARRF